MNEIDLSDLKAFCIERSRVPAEGVDAKGRALFACLVLPQEIQKWIIDAGALEPLIASIEATILAAERAAASELLEALRAIAALKPEDMYHGEDSTAHAIARDAIAKAEGQSVSHTSPKSP